MTLMHATTILSVRTDTQVAIAGDGQVSLGDTVVKASAKKIRRLYKDQVLVGFAGATADAFTLFERFEGQLEKYQGNLERSAVELAKEWRSDRILRRLEAMLIVADATASLMVSGAGDVLRPEKDVVAIGSGGNYARSAALALVDNCPDMKALDIATKSLAIAADICVYTNHSIVHDVVDF